jgi:hypothetical protein
MLKIRWGTLPSLPYKHRGQQIKNYLVVYYDQNRISLGEAVIYDQEEIEEYISPSDFQNLKKSSSITLTTDSSWINEYGIYSLSIEEIK